MSFAAARIDAWNGIAVVGNLVCMAGTGGHGDWGGNEAYSCDLSSETPVWKMLREPTADSLIARDSSYYLDGRPTSSHTYYALHGDAQRNRIFRVGIGSAFGAGGFNRPTVDAFNLALNDWDPAGRWPDAPEGLSLGMAQTTDERTGDYYVAGLNKLWRMRGDSRIWDSLATLPGTGATYYRGSLFDTKRQRLVIMGNRYRTPRGIMLYDAMAASFNSSASVADSLGEGAVAEAGHTAHYHEATDQYLVKTNSAGDVVALNPSTFAAQVLPVLNGASVPGAINGVFTKFVYCAALKGYAYQPQGASRLWFLAEPL